MRGVAGLAAALLCVATLGACSSDEQGKLLRPSGLRVAPDLPVDSTDSGEIAEGEERAFGFPLPRDMRTRARLKDAWFARGKMSLEDLANYVRERVVATMVTTGPAKTVFIDAVVLNNPKMRVRVEVARVHGGVELVVRNRRRMPAERGLTPAQRWEKAGLTPRGEVLDKMAE